MDRTDDDRSKEAGPSTVRSGPVPPLAGLRAIDLSQVLAGPYATWALAQLGAEVIKVEPPGGDASMQVGPFVRGTSLYHRTVNAGKVILTEDLSTQSGRKHLDDLLSTADILIHNLRADSAERLGVAPRQLSVRHPRLVMVTIAGFADGTPEGGRPAYDLVIQALSGIMSLTGNPDQPPFRAGVPVSDLAAGLWAAIGALAGLRHRDISGDGGHLEVPMLDASLSLLSYIGTDAATTGNTPVRIGNQHPAVVPYGSYEAADGHVVIAVYSDRFWPSLCHALELRALKEDSALDRMAGRVARREEVNAAIQGAIAGRTRAAVLAVLEAHDVPCAPVLEVDEALATPYVRGRAVVRDVEENSVAYRTIAAPIKGIKRSDG